MTSINLKLELARIVEGLQIAQKKGSFNLDEAAMVHSAILSIQKANLVAADSVPVAKENTEELNSLLEQQKQWSNDKNILLQQRQQLIGERDQYKSERDQLVNLLDEYKNAIEDFKKKHDEQVFNLNISNEKIKELKLQMNIYEKENAELRNDLSELINADMEEVKDEVIPVVKAKSEKPKKKKLPTK